MSQMTKSILDKAFVYFDSSNTDVSRTFERIRREQKLKQEQAAKDEAERKEKVEIIRRRA
jgi:hypothetical protein